MPARVIGDWVLDELLAKRPFGEVYRAHNQAAGQAVQALVKLIGSQWMEDPEVRDRFVREARSVFSLKSPHIVIPRTFGEQEGVLYLVTELPDGGSLADLLARLQGGQETMSLRARVDLVCQAAEGVAVAHESPGHLVHRDLSPAVLMLERRPALGDQAPYLVKLSDLGLVRALEGPTVTHRDLHATNSGAYMAPEQFLGRAVDERTDIYALGLILYEVLSGRRPFSCRTPAEAYEQHVGGAVPSLRAIVSELPREVDEIVRACLDKEPAKRPTSARQLIAALRAWSGDELGPPSGSIDARKSRLDLEPGKPSSLVLLIRNTGQVVVHWEVAVEGFPAEWVRRTEDALQLNPGDKVEYALTLLVPRDPMATAGERPVRLSLRSVTNGRDLPDSEVKLTWTVLPMQDPLVLGEVLPARVLTQEVADYTVELHNPNNCAEKAQVSFKDPNHRLKFEPLQHTCELAPGTSERIGLTVRHPRFAFGRAREHRFVVQLGGGRGVPVPPKEGIYVQERWVPAWAMVVAALTALGLIGVLWILITGDKCPFAMEEPNDIVHDGCPHPDNDGDGVLDVQDGSVNLAEDPDGFDDQDGSPDYDNDKDGVLDADDKCKNSSEDFDNHEDADGCLDPNNDGDPLNDDKDGCPDYPAQTATGCPNYLPDGDDDGVPDPADTCPADVGVARAYGCPDRDRDTVPDPDLNGDGLPKPEIADQCPDEYGSPTARGCPDIDKDGVPDRDDPCPTVPGVDPQLCPNTNQPIRFEAEDLAAKESEGSTINRDVRSFPIHEPLSGEKMLLWKKEARKESPRGPKDRRKPPPVELSATDGLSLSFPVATTGRYDLVITQLVGPEYALVSFSENGLPLGTTQERDPSGAYTMVKVSLGTQTWDKGIHMLKLTPTAAGPDGANIAIDYIEITRRDATTLKVAPSAR